MKKILTLLLTAALIMSFYGCRGGRDEISGDESSTSNGAENEEKAALDEVRQSDLDCPARTVALTEEAAKLWLLAGGELCAVCDCENVIPGLKGNEKKLGKKGRITAEEVLKLSPDYVLCDDSLANAEEIREALSKSGIRCEDITITSFDDYFSTIKNFCMMTKNADAYEKAALNVRGRRTAIMRNAAGEMPDLLLSLGMEETMGSRPAGAESGRDPKADGAGSVGFELIRVSSDGAVIASNNDWVCSMLEDLGLVNLCTGEAAAEKEAFEKVLQKDPDFIFVIYCGNEKQGKEKLDDLTGSMKGWKNMKAVKFNHMITLPKESFCSLPNDAWDLPMEYLYQSIFLMG